MMKLEIKVGGAPVSWAAKDVFHQQVRQALEKDGWTNSDYRTG